MAQIKSWTISDELWGKIEPLVPARPERPQGRQFHRKPGGGRKPLPDRQVFEAIVFVLRTGIQWKALPRGFGSSSAVHKRFQQWERAGFFLRVWQAGLAEYDGMRGIAWEWQSVDGALGKAPLATECAGPNPTDRGKKGRKRSLLTDGNGVPLSLVVAGANRHDSKLLAPTLDSIVVERPAPSGGKQHLCADAGYMGKPCMKTARERGCEPHIKQRREEAAGIRAVPAAKARRWVVERTHSWPNRWRKLLVSFEKTEASYTGLLSLAAALICWRQIITIYG